MNHLLGFEANRELLASSRDVAEGEDAEGHSYMFHHLLAREDRLRVSVDELSKWDLNIMRHLDEVSSHRPEPLSLRYFQYLALLFTEMYLDWYFHRPGRLLADLNAFLNEQNLRAEPDQPLLPTLAREDMRKVAFWMATGSGKTMIMYFNVLQFLSYRGDAPLDNILLVTPNEDLSNQHIAELQSFGARCERFVLQGDGLSLESQPPIRVIEITKLVEEKRGGGISVDVEAFEGDNLILVDEGHKGVGGVAWRGFRDRLSEYGFTFEYSATFGQALAARGGDEVTEEYSKAILFDYSYKYFHGDGFGKDFKILNFGEEASADAVNDLLIGNLLALFEQLEVFHQDSGVLAPYRLETPLWVLVGSSVTTRQQVRQSDVLTVVKFLERFLRQRTWAEKRIEAILNGNADLAGPDGEDPFREWFRFLRESARAPRDIYDAILQLVFQTQTGSSLHLVELRGHDGEIALRASDSGSYFGLIYIGDTAAFRALVSEETPTAVVEDDVLSESLFETLSDADSPVRVLIGARKFVVGWNSWRVASMGLLNIGRSEGPEIIQLFGRGVRLRGFDYSLKRSSALPSGAPPRLNLLETLNIFALRANYMAQFREYLSREDLEVEGYSELELPIQRANRLLKRELLAPKHDPDRDFEEEVVVVLEPDDASTVRLDLRIRIGLVRMRDQSLETEALRAGSIQVIPSPVLDLLNWKRVHLALADHKRVRGFFNLVLDPAQYRSILEHEPRLYELLGDDGLAQPTNVAGIARTEEAVIAILKKYLDKYYRVCQQRWDTKVMRLTPLDGSEDNFRDYSVRVPRSNRQLLADVSGLITDAKKVYDSEVEELPSVFFEGHLYQPLLVEASSDLGLSPKGLNKGEAQFVRDLRGYVKERGLTAGRDVFLLRNLSRGRGIGFFEREGFYPDFILWQVAPRRQRIVFLEPHGMLHEKAYTQSERTQLHVRLKQFGEQLKVEPGIAATLDAFIISTTPYERLRPVYGDGSWSRDMFTQAHILFYERNKDYDYQEILFGSGVSPSD